MIITAITAACEALRRLHQHPGENYSGDFWSGYPIAHTAAENLDRLPNYRLDDTEIDVITGQIAARYTS